MSLLKIYGDLRSGNCLKIKYEWVSVDLMKGESRTVDFLQKNPAGQVPVVELDDGRFLSQSNAIIKYLARGSSLVSSDDFINAQIDQWLFWEQYSHEPALAVLRFKILFLKKSLSDVDPLLIEKSYKALDLMESHLRDKKFFVGEKFSVADIALVAYTRLADEAQLDLKKYSLVQKWITVCEEKLHLRKCEN